MRFTDLHHHDLRPGEPPEGQLDGGEGNEGGQGFGKEAGEGATLAATEPENAVLETV